MVRGDRHVERFIAARQGGRRCWGEAPETAHIIAHLAGATAIGSAIFLILELSNPYTGLIHMSPAGIDSALSEFKAAPGERRAPVAG